MVGDSREFFSLLERFDLAAVHAPYRAQYQICEVPDCFPELNTGVLLFRQSAQTGLLFEQWAQIYREDGKKPLNWFFPGGASLYRHAIPNQPSFRRALYESGLRIATSPPEYNCRFPFSGFLLTKIKNLHGHVHSFTKISEELNKILLPRVHVMRWENLKTLESAMPPGEDILARTRWSLHHRGILQTAWATMGRCMRRLWKIFT